MEAGPRSPSSPHRWSGSIVLYARKVYGSGAGMQEGSSSPARVREHGLRTI